MQVLMVSFVEMIAELGNLTCRLLLQPSEGNCQAVLQMVSTAGQTLVGVKPGQSSHHHRPLVMLNQPFSRQYP
jgi:hypothetical protein